MLIVRFKMAMTAFFSTTATRRSCADLPPPRHGVIRQRGNLLVNRRIHDLLQKALHGVGRVRGNVAQLQVVRLGEPQHIGFDDVGPALRPRDTAAGAGAGDGRRRLGPREKGLQGLGRSGRGAWDGGGTVQSW